MILNILLLVASNATNSKEPRIHVQNLTFE